MHPMRYLLLLFLPLTAWAQFGVEQPMFAAPAQAADPMLGLSMTNIAYWWHAADAPSGTWTNWTDKIKGAKLVAMNSGAGYRTNDYVSLQRVSGTYKNYQATNLTELNSTTYAFVWVASTPGSSGVWTANELQIVNSNNTAGVQYSVNAGTSRVYHYTGGGDWFTGWDVGPLVSTNIHDYGHLCTSGNHNNYTNGIYGQAASPTGVTFGSTLIVYGNANSDSVDDRLYDLMIFTNVAATVPASDYVVTNVHRWRTNYYGGSP